MSVRMIILLGIFVWAPMMAYLAYKYVQTFAVVQRGRSGKRRAKRAQAPSSDRLYDMQRKRLGRSF